MRARLVLVPVAVAAALLAGCGKTASTPDATATTTPASTAPADNGVSSLSGEEIMKKAQTALSSASAYQLKGEANADGGKITIEMKYSDSGKNYSGTVTNAGVAIELIKIGNDLYVKAPESFLQKQLPGGASVGLTMLKGKWIKTTSDNKAFGDMANVFSATSLLEIKGTVTKGEISTIDGVEVIAVSTPGNTYYVATKGEPYTVKVEDKVNTGTIAISKFGTAVEITAPPADQVFDLKGLAG